MILFSLFAYFVVLETKPYPECGWLHWCGFRGLAQDLWWIYSVSLQTLVIF